MTREEIKDFCDMKIQLEPENEDIFKAIVKELEQEPVIDKLRAEIAEYGSICVAYDISRRRYKDIEELVIDVLKQAKEQVLDIVDKYKTESEPQESENT